MSDFKPMNECKGFNMERVLLKNKNGYMVTAYLKDGMLQCDGDEAWSQPMRWDGFIRLQELANKPTTSTEPSIVNEPVLGVVDLRKKLLSMRFLKQDIKDMEDSNRLAAYGFTECINEVLEFINKDNSD